MVAGQGCSLRSFASLSYCDRRGSYWKTRQRLLMPGQGMEPFSERWPRSGMTVNGIAYRLPDLVPRISGTGYSSLPNTGRGWKGTKRKSIASSAGYLFLVDADASTENGSVGTAGSGHIRGTTAGRMGATPAAPQMWPTPTANEDAAGTPDGNMQRMLGNHPAVRGEGGGVLNPTWVEWLMGFPAGWTDLEG